jgi:hypothetical protein
MWTANPLQEDLARFGYRLNRNILQLHSILARPYNQNMANFNPFQPFFSSKYGEFFRLFPKKWFAEVRDTFFFGSPGGKTSPQKKQCT